jgi:cytoskeletal protein CcmA (bactofilin family)
MRKIPLILIVIIFAPLIAIAEDGSFKTVRGNIYSAGGSIAITEDASNDIVAAGGNVVINGDAGNGILAAGGSVLLSGKTGGDARVAGGSVTISGEIGGEAVAAGGRIHLLPDAGIKSDLIAAGGDVVIDGTIGGGAKIIGGTVLITGTIQNDVEIKAREVVIARNAVLKGRLRYEAPQEARLERGAVIAGEKVFIKREFGQPRQDFVRMLWIGWVVKVIAVLAAALAVFFALREKTVEVTGLAVNRFANETLIGFIVLVAVPAAVLVLFMTVIGWVLGLAGIFLYIAFVMVSGVFGALVFTRLMSGYLFKKEPSFTWPVILLGVLIHQVIGLVPFLGWVFKFVFFLAALGALSHLVAKALKGKHTSVSGAASA